jgi:hypothetical protein
VPDRTEHSRLRSLSVAVAALAVLAVPNAERIDCATTGDRYSAALAQVVEALRAYEKCVTASDKRNDCAAEMQALDNAHDDLADAIDDAKSCR